MYVGFHVKCPTLHRNKRKFNVFDYNNQMHHVKYIRVVRTLLPCVSVTIRQYRVPILKPTVSGNYKV
jgi:hypothetical protein